ncbi:MAG: DNA/RNA nuclease SfsA, partial [Thaumarchaeota archaeon]|nr:DNA/RNA nuclease SfsA [Nitrososphaerota archaeon]
MMEVPGSIKCRVIERVNRFVVKIDLSGSEVLAYLQNTGRLREYLKQDRIGFCAPLKNPGRLRYRLFAVKDDGFSALIDTLL